MPGWEVIVMNILLYSYKNKVINVLEKLCDLLSMCIFLGNETKIYVYTKYSCEGIVS